MHTLIGGRHMTADDELGSPHTFEATQRYDFGIPNTKHACDAIGACCLTSVQTSQFLLCLMHTLRLVFELTLHTVQWAGGV